MTNEQKYYVDMSFYKFRNALACSLMDPLGKSTYVAPYTQSCLVVAFHIHCVLLEHKEIRIDQVSMSRLRGEYAVHGAVDDGVATRAQVLACVRGDDALSGGGDREPRGGSVRRSLPERLRRQLPGPIAG